MTGNGRRCRYSMHSFSTSVYPGTDARVRGVVYGGHCDWLLGGIVGNLGDSPEVVRARRYMVLG